MKGKSYEKKKIPEPPTRKFRGSLREHPLPNDPENPKNIINYTETKEFSKDLKWLSEKYPSLPNDLEKFKQNVINNIPDRKSKHSHNIKGTGCVIVKRNMHCISLGNSDIRVVYAFFPESGKVEFIEMYYKSDSTKEDCRRINVYLKNLKKPSKTT